MIVAIKSTKEVTIKSDSRSGSTETGFVEITISEITHRLSDDARLFKIEDFLLIPYPESVDPDTEEVIPSGIIRKRLKIGNSNSKTIVKSKTEYEGLKAYFESEYPEASFNDMLQFALLSETQNSPVYGTTANDWQS